MSKVRTCAFCGNEYTVEEIENFEKILFKSPIQENIRICDACVEHCKKTLDGLAKKIEGDSESVNEKKEKKLTPAIIKEGLDEWIIGQEKAKYKVAVALYNHYKRLKNTTNEYKSDVVIQKSNIMLVGPTGSGKTEIVRALASQLDLPYVIEDVTSITSAGYVGRDTDDILKNLIACAGGDIKKAQRGIVFLDEGDKLRRKKSGNSEQKDVNGEGVQQGLLKMVEGGVVDIKRDKQSSSVIKFDTTNVLFIIGGAFEGIEELISERLKTKDKDTSIGINAVIESKKKSLYNDVITQVKHEDLEKFGMTPELLGRFPVIAPLQELSEEALISILTEPKNALVKQYKKLFAMDNIELEIVDSALIAMAKEAKKRKIGARALRSIMEETLDEAMFKAPSEDDIIGVIIEEDLLPLYTKQEQTSLEI